MNGEMIINERNILNFSKGFRSFPKVFVFFALCLQIQSSEEHGYDNYNPYHHPRTADVAVEEVLIPHPVRVGQTAQLKCVWRVGSNGFYSLRWYKDDVQFYSYIKGEEANTHNVDGIHVIIKESDDHVVTLRGVTAKAEGIYKCEIMTDGPKFKISQSHANLTIVELPETPQLVGVRQRYMVGDTLNITCRAPNGRPPPTLIMKINDIAIHDESGRLTQLPTLSGDRPGVFTSRTRLTMPLSDALHPEFKLGCYAHAEGLLVQKEITIPVTRRRSFLTLFGGGGAADSARSSVPVTCICAALALLRTTAPKLFC